MFLYKYDITNSGSRPMRDHHPSLGNPQIPTSAMADTAALENFVRLKQSQTDFLAWLDTSEQQASVDRYTYRKIR
jgi:hypothetical protein